MKTRTRTEYSVMNTSVAFVAQAAAILMGFFTRVVFTRTLSEGYVGINGLFTDILNILSLSELGVGTAITFALYEPIAKNDIKKQQILMQMFRSFYRMTAAFVLGAGLLLVPFLNILMKDRPDVDHLLLIYLLYLSNSVISYLLIYKKTLVSAHQLNYLTVLYHNGFLVLQDICQILVLLLTGNFILFLIVAILCTFVGNVCMSKKADELFPYLKEKCTEKLPENEKQEIGKNVRAMMMHKLGNVVVNNTDNLLISSFVGVVSAGVYSNYFLIIGSVRQVLDQALQGVTASVGNLGAMEAEEKVQKVFGLLFFIGQWVYGFAAICLFELLNPFVELAFGKKYLFTREIVLILCVNFFINGTRKAVIIFKESMGAFWYDRYKAVVEAALNLVISIVLVLKFGIFGVFAGTFFSTVLTSVWVEPYILFKYRFRQSPAKFYLRYAGNVLMMAVAWGLTDLCCSVFQAGALLNLGVRFLICLVIPNAFLWLVYRRTDEWREVSELLKRIIGKIWIQVRRKAF